jgi:hypothetical protein
MRGVGELRRGWVAFSVIVLAGLLLSGCETVRGRPERLIPVAQEAQNAREALPDIAGRYQSATSDTDRKRFRNEYIALRMYIIDAEFTEYEIALTKERGEFGLTTALVVQGLTTAGAVFTPVNTVRTLSALAGGVNASRGFYDSELLANKTIQIIQSQMEAKRDDVASRILSKVDFPPDTYTLPSALHDLEDYYRAGTLTSGLIKATAEAGLAAQQAAANKEIVMMLPGGRFDPTDALRKIVLSYLAPGPKRAARVQLLRDCLGPRFPLAPILYASNPNMGSVRVLMQECAKRAGDPM